MKRKILIIDDNAEQRELLSMALGYLKVLTFEAKSGTEGLEKLREVDVDLVLMDLEMPRMNGFETIKNIRHILGLKDLPIMVVSGSVDRPSLQKVLELGITEVLVKPIKMELLVQKVNQLLH